MTRIRQLLLTTSLAIAVLWSPPLLAQTAAPPVSPQRPLTPAPPPPGSMVERIDEHTFRLDQIRIDTAKHELTVQGHVNDAYVLEFVACTRGGLKAYESALTIDTNGIALNTALILIGLDKAH